MLFYYAFYSVYRIHEFHILITIVAGFLHTIKNILPRMKT